MSNVSTPAELDFWEFVGCGVCHNGFVKETGVLSSVPFWLTDCGHVICNNHLNPDQTCMVCGAQCMHLMPLAREMESPMSDWFTSAPIAFDAVGFALRFQMNTMANEIRYFKRKYAQYRPLYDRLKEEHAENKRLKKELATLQMEIQHLKQVLRSGTGAESVNENHKRRRVDDEGQYRGLPTSSPRSVASVSTPVGPDRLTLPPGHQQPQFNTRQSHQRYESVPPQQNLAQYAYIPPRSAQGQPIPPPVLSHVQSGPMRRVQAAEDGVAQQSSNRIMAPPPVPANRALEQRPTMRLPSTPAILPQRPSFAPPSTGSQAGSSSTSQRFVPQTPSKTSLLAEPAASTSRTWMTRPSHAPQQQAQRFLLPNTTRLPSMVASATPGSLASSGQVSQPPSRSPSMAVSGAGGQRTPFVPGSS